MNGKNLFATIISPNDVSVKKTPSRLCNPIRGKTINGGTGRDT
jgi:hypothetical protein